MEFMELTELKEGLQSVIGKIDRFCFYSKRQQFYYGNSILLELCQEIPDITDRLLKIYRRLMARHLFLIWKGRLRYCRNFRGHRKTGTMFF